jgi:tetratricopeptide (TPR) repeat protein
MEKRFISIKLSFEFDFLSHSLQVFDEGIKALEGRGDDLAVLLHLKGTVLAEKLDYEAAIKEFRAALEMRPNMEDAMFSLGWSYSYVNPDNAKIWLNKFVQAASQRTRADYLAAAQGRLSEIELGTPFQ